MKKNSNYIYSIYIGSKLRNKSYAEGNVHLWNSGS
jgi:hypothetical protein